MPRGHREQGTGHPCGGRDKDGDPAAKNGQLVTVDGEMGLVYEGAVGGMAQAKAGAAVPAAPGGGAPIITATSVKVNVSIPEAAARAAATGADGVGLLRIQHLILGLNKTPGRFIANHKEEEFVKEALRWHKNRA